MAISNPTPPQASNPPTQPAPPPQASLASSPASPAQPSSTTSQSNPPPPPPPEVKSSPFRYIIPILLGLVVIIALVFAVRYFLNRNQEESTPDQPVTITYWGLWEPSQVLDSILTQFEVENPHIKVDYQQQSYQNYRERLQNSISQGGGPDAFRFHNTWIPMIGSQLDSVPEEVFSSQEFDQTFYPVANNWLASDNTILGIPLMFDGLALYYNQDIFSAAGLTPPTSWDELRRTAKQLTLSTDGQILRGGIALGTTENVEHFSDIIGLMLIQNSADPSQPNNNLGQDALTFYSLFYKTDRVWDETLPSSTFAFATEKAAMMIAPSWRAHDVAQINPELNFATAPVPQLPETNINWASFWAEGVSNNTSKEKQQASWQLLQYLSQKEVLRQFYSDASDSPGRLFGEPFSRIDLADQLTADPLVGSYIDSAPTAKSWFLSSYTHDNGINDQIIKYYQDAINAINQGSTAQDALEPVEAGVAQILSNYQGAP